jgi:hypothetical protein
MVISSIHLTPLLAKLDEMTKRAKKFRTMAHRCEELFNGTQINTIFFNGIQVKL